MLKYYLLLKWLSFFCHGGPQKIVNEHRELWSMDWWQMKGLTWINDCVFIQEQGILLPWFGFTYHLRGNGHWKSIKNYQSDHFYQVWLNISSLIQDAWVDTIQYDLLSVIITFTQKFLFKPNLKLNIVIQQFIGETLLLHCCTNDVVVVVILRIWLTFQLNLWRCGSLRPQCCLPWNTQSVSQLCHLKIWIWTTDTKRSDLTKKSELSLKCEHSSAALVLLY